MSFNLMTDPTTFRFLLQQYLQQQPLNFLPLGQNSFPFNQNIVDNQQTDLSQNLNNLDQSGTDELPLDLSQSSAPTYLDHNESNKVQPDISQVSAPNDSILSQTPSIFNPHQSSAFSFNQNLSLNNAVNTFPSTLSQTLSQSLPSLSSFDVSPVHDQTPASLNLSDTPSIQSIQPNLLPSISPILMTRLLLNSVQTLASLNQPAAIERPEAMYPKEFLPKFLTQLPTFEDFQGQQQSDEQLVLNSTPQELNSSGSSANQYSIEYEDISDDEFPVNQEEQQTVDENFEANVPDQTEQQTVDDISETNVSDQTEQQTANDISTDSVLNTNDVSTSQEGQQLETNNTDEQQLNQNTDQLKENRQNKQGECKLCAVFTRIYKHGFCMPCYEQKLFESNKANMRSGAECKECAQLKFCPVKGVCNSCYSRNKYELKVNDLTRHKECKECKQVKFIHAQEMCGNCYSRKFQQESKLDLRKYKDCKKCGNFKYVHAQGMCQPCYSRTWSKARKSNLTKNKECKVCGKVKYCPSRGMCGTCYARVHTREKEAEEEKRDQEMEVSENESDQNNEESESDGETANSSSSCSRTRPFKRNKVGRPPKFPKSLKSQKCYDCGEGKKLAARGRCQKCYKLVLTQEKEARDGITVLKVIKKRGRPRKKVMIIKRFA